MSENKNVESWLLAQYKTANIEGLQINTVMDVLKDTLAEIEDKKLFGKKLPMSKNLSVSMNEIGEFEVQIAKKGVLEVRKSFTKADLSISVDEGNSIAFKEIKSLKGTGPENFADFVAMLERPYFPISKDELDKAMELSKEQDFILYDNRVMTFGAADNGYALMPLQDKYAAKILKDNNMISVSGRVIGLQIGSEKKESASSHIDPKNARYEMFMEAAQQVAGVYGISVEQYFDITLNRNIIDFKNDVKFSQIHDWVEADEFVGKFVNEHKMPICKEVNEMSESEVKEGLREGYKLPDSEIEKIKRGSTVEMKNAYQSFFYVVLDVPLNINDKFKVSGEEGVRYYRAEDFYSVSNSLTADAVTPDISSDVAAMSDDEIKAGMDEIATKDTGRSLDLN